MANLDRSNYPEDSGYFSGGSDETVIPPDERARRMRRNRIRYHMEISNNIIRHIDTTTDIININRNMIRAYDIEIPSIIAKANRIGIFNRLERERLLERARFFERVRLYNIDMYRHMAIIIRIERDLSVRTISMLRDLINVNTLYISDTDSESDTVNGDIDDDTDLESDTVNGDIDDDTDLESVNGDIEDNTPIRPDHIRINICNQNVKYISLLCFCLIVIVWLLIYYLILQ
jgi:PAS domain-containing protein